MDTERPRPVEPAAPKQSTRTKLASRDNVTLSDSASHEVPTLILPVTKAASRCGTGDCRGKIALVGHCKYCDTEYCLKHRLPEVHDCKNRETMRSTAFEANREQLMHGKTTDHRGFEKM